MLLLRMILRKFYSIQNIIFLYVGEFIVFRFDICHQVINTNYLLSPKHTFFDEILRIIALSLSRFEDEFRFEANLV